VHPRATTYPIALNLTCLPRWAPALPRDLRPRTLPPCRDGLWHCHVSCGLGPRLLAKVSSGVATSPSAPDLISLLR
jgi:hypothetical protein